MGRSYYPRLIIRWKRSRIASCLLLLLFAFFSNCNISGQDEDISSSIENRSFNPAEILWYTAPARKWEEALPAGNGRLGTMVFGKTDEERIHLKDTGEVSGYRRWLNLSSGITGVEYEKDRVIFRREVCFDLYDFCK